MTQAAVTRNSSLPCPAYFTTSGYQGLADSRIAGLGLMMRSATCERACWARRGCAVSVKYVSSSASFNGRVKVVMYHSRNGMRTNAKVRTRIATSHFFAIPDFAGTEEASAGFCCVIIWRLSRSESRSRQVGRSSRRHSKAFHHRGHGVGKIGYEIPSQCALKGERYFALDAAAAPLLGPRLPSQPRS